LEKNKVQALAELLKGEKREVSKEVVFESEAE